MNKWITIGILLTIIILLVAFRNKLTGLFTKKNTQTPAQQAAAVQAAVTASQHPGNNAPALDNNKYLYKGVTGNEVRVLQGLLGVTQDGNFGPLTEAALQNQKCVVATTLNTFPTQSCSIDANGGDGTSSDNGSSWLDSVPYGYIFSSY